MTNGGKDSIAPGTYHEDADGARTLVHLYQGGPYRLVEIVDLWQLGRIEGGRRAGESVVVLDRADMRRLKTLADAFSFDNDQGFIEMCLEMHRFALNRPEETFRFVATF